MSSVKWTEDFDKHVAFLTRVGVISCREIHLPYLDTMARPILQGLKRCDAMVTAKNGMTIAVISFIYLIWCVWEFEVRVTYPVFVTGHKWLKLSFTLYFHTKCCHVPFACPYSSKLIDLQHFSFSYLVKVVLNVILAY